MTARRLGRCPTCAQPLSDAVRESMGARNGEALNAMCPGKIGPSDIDHVIHVLIGDKVAFFEYKDGGAALSGGQSIMLDALAGEWVEPATGRRLNVRYFVIPNHPPDINSAYQSAISWLWTATHA